MKFRTEVEPVSPGFRIKHENKIFTIGSCFAENIAEYFKFYRFSILDNPFGVLYNPVSILNAVKSSKSKKRFLFDDLIYHQSEYHSFFHHSDFSHHNAEECLRRINSKIDETHSFLSKADIVIISYGTSVVYKHKKSGMIVSNNHKIPAKEFEKLRLTVDEITEYANRTTAALKELNPDAKIILTVSPVRHWRDGATENLLSKSALLLAIEKIVNKNEDFYYFPSYEILMDDLRDYRFYSEDLIHPNRQALEYVWEKFKSVFFDEKTASTLEEIGKISTARNHRPRNIHTGEHQKFLKSILSKINELEKKYTHLDLSGDKNYFAKDLSN